MVIAVESLPTPSSNHPAVDDLEALSAPPATQRTRHSRSTTSSVAGMFPALYEDLRRIGRRMLRSERAGHLLEPCALVNEAYLRLRSVKAPVNDRKHCVRLVAQVMYRVLVDHARTMSRDKRELPCPEELERLQLMPYEGQTPVDIVDIKGALAALARENTVAAEMVQLHWYFGVDPAELEALFGISEAGVTRTLRYARKWLAAFAAGEGGQALPSGVEDFGEDEP